MLEAVIERISEHAGAQSCVSFFTLYDAHRAQILTCYAVENIKTKLPIGNYIAEWQIPKKGAGHEVAPSEPALLIDKKLTFGNFCNGSISKNCVSLGDTTTGDGFVYDTKSILNKFLNLAKGENLSIIVKELL